jgi:hypothetical protein
MLKLSKHPLAPSASHSGKRKSNTKDISSIKREKPRLLQPKKIRIPIRKTKKHSPVYITMARYRISL